MSQNFNKVQARISHSRYDKLGLIVERDLLIKTLLCEDVAEIVISYLGSYPFFSFDI